MRSPSERSTQSSIVLSFSARLAVRALIRVFFFDGAAVDLDCSMKCSHLFAPTTRAGWPSDNLEFAFQEAFLDRQ